VAKHSGGFVEEDAGFFAEGVADAEVVVADDADDIAGVGFIDGLAVLGEEALGVGEADGFAGARIVDGHVPFEGAGDDADEVDAVAVAGVHVGLDLEDEGGEVGGGGFDEVVAGEAGSGWGGELEEGVEEELDAEVVVGGAEEDGGELTFVDEGAVEGVAGAFEHGEFIDGFGEGVFVDLGLDEVIAERSDADGGAEGAAGGAFEEVYCGVAAVVEAAEEAAEAEGPVDGAGGDAEDGFEFVDEFERRFGGPVEFVHEGEDGDASFATDFEEFAGLGLDAVAGVDDHDGGVDGCEDTVGVFGEVFVAGGVEEVDDAVFVFELEDGGGDGDAALFFEFHPVGGSGALVFAGGDGACELDGAAVEEEFFGEGGFAGVGVRDDGEGAAAGDFLDGGHAGGDGRAGRGKCTLKMIGVIQVCWGVA
jgi:hypothetical protein